jgi:hypothetical protein
MAFTFGLAIRFFCPFTNLSALNQATVLIYIDLEK